MAKENEINKETKENNSWLRRVVRFGIYLFAILLLLILSLNIPFVQNFLITKVANNLSEKLEADVSLSHFNIGLTKGLILQDLTIVEKGDTIIYCQELDVSLKKSLFNILDGRLYIDEIDIRGAKFNIVTDDNEDISNVEKLLAKLSTDRNEDTKGEPMVIDVSRISLNNVGLSVKSCEKGLESDYSLKKAVIKFRELDLNNNNFNIENLDLVEPTIVIRRVDFDYSDEIVGVEEELPLDTMKQLLGLVIDNFNIDGGYLRYDNELIQELNGENFDFNHYELNDLTLRSDGIVYFEGDSLKLNLEQFGFKDKNGFKLENISLGNLVANNKQIRSNNLRIQTKHSQFSNEFQIQFRNIADLKKMSNKMLAKLTFDKSNISLEELAYFIPDLRNSAFFIKNRGLDLVLQGKLSGRPKSFSGNDINLEIGNLFRLAGNFSTRNVTDFDNALLNLNVKDLRTSITFLRNFIPDFNPPSNFDKLNKFSFSGRFDGFFKDFVAYGKLDSDVGIAKMDMRLDIKEGVGLAKYSGVIDLIQFDLGKWTENPKFGLIDFSSKVDRGIGLTASNASADLSAVVHSLAFNDYDYKDFVLDGHLENNKFEGLFQISDKNLDVIFEGNVDATQEKPVLKFSSKVENIDLQALNFSKNSLSFSGDLDVNLLGSNIDNIVGDLRSKNFIISKNDSIYSFDSLIVKSLDSGDDLKSLSILSDYGYLTVDGDYQLSNFGNSLKKIFEVNYKYPAEILKIHAKDIETPEKYRFDLGISNSENLFNLLGINGLVLKNFKAKGGLNTIRNELDFAVNTPYIGIGNNVLYDVQILANSANEKGDILVNIDSSKVIGIDLSTIDIQAKLYSDTASVLFSTYNLTDSIERFDLLTTVIPDEKGYELRLKDEELLIYGKKWKINPDNRIVIGKGYHEVSNLVMTDATRFVEIGDIGNRGVDLNLQNFDLERLNPIIDYDKMDFSGAGNLSFSIDDVYNDNFELTANARVDNFYINEDSYGLLEFDVTKRKSKPIEALFSLTKDEMSLKADAYYNIDSKRLNSTVKSKNFPMKIFEYMLYEGISETEGVVDVDAEVSGPIDKLEMTGGGIVKNGAVKIIYLGTKYFFDNQRIKLTENKIDMTGAVITDELGGEGIVTGGLSHTVFRNFKVDANIRGEDVLVLNTTKEDNPVYYGTGKGRVSVDFKGESFGQVNMTIDAETGPGSVLSIPIEETQLGAEESFIKFVTQEDVDNAFKVKDEEEFKIEGLSIEMNLTMTDDLDVNLIFDEKRGDIISGNGSGDIRVVINRVGDFDIFGEYEIETGQYLFTALGLVNKYFSVRNGGKVIWTGDPINATLDIKADYSTRSSLSSFVSGFNGGDPEFDKAIQASQEVDLILNLGGTLYSPDIQFDMEFPNLTSGELSTAVNNKMLQLRENPNDLNNQVLGLIVFNSFIPSSSLASDFASQSFLQSAGINTLSEFLSSQLSQIVTSLLTASLEENGLISDIDFDINVRNTTLLGVDASNSLTPNEIEVRLNNRFRFLDERLEFQVGGNYVRESAFQNQNYIVPDFVIQYYLTEDRKLKLRLYGKYDYDVIENFDSRNQKYGLGIGYSTNFGSLYTLKEVLKERVVKSE